MYQKFTFLASFVLVCLIAGSVYAQPFQQDPGPDGIVSFEAEHYDANVENGGHAWVETGPTGGFTGTAGMWAPNGQGGHSSNYLTNSERLDFEINFVQTGIHYVWILAWGESGSDDSCHAGLDGDSTLSSQMSGWNNNYQWSNNRYQQPGPSRINVTSTGPHTFNLWVREDGLIIDKIVITSNPDFSLSGNEPGPPESIRGAVLNAYGPNPADGALYADTWANLSWSAGDTAASHDVYLGESFDDVNNRSAETFRGSPSSPSIIVGFLGAPYPDGLVQGTTYYWRVDEVEADGTTKHEGPVWSFRIPPLNAYDPSPTDGAILQDTDMTLKWNPGLNVILQTIYFGDNFEDVNNAAVPGVSQTTTDFTPPGPLENDKTYYWRVDQVNPPTTVKGKVWSFTTLPEIPITDPNLVGWWKFEAGKGTKVVDWSGHGNHGTISGAANVQWVSSIYNMGLEFLGDYQGFVELPPGIVTTGAGSVLMWINTTQDDDEGMLWYGSAVNYGNGYGGENEIHLNIDNSGTGQLDFFLEEDGSGSDITINGPDVGGHGWTHVAATWDLVDGCRMYVNGVQVGFEPHNTNVKDLVIMRLGSAAEDDVYYEGIMDDVRLFDHALSADEVIEIYSKGEDPRRPGSPQPVNGSLVDLIAAAPLSWSPGEGVSEHDVYFGTDQDSVAYANATDTSGVYRGRHSTTTYTPSDVEWAGGPYYWRIDEILSDGTIVKGGVWSFTVTDYLIVDDFEPYNDIASGEPDSNLIYETWMDGYDNPNANGAAIGYVSGASMETANAHGGSGQSAPMTFNNTTAPISEATRTISPVLDLTKYGITTLSLFVYEVPGNVGGDVYVKINGSKVPLIDESTYPAGFNPGWVLYNVDLTAINISNLRTLTIGVDGMNAQGTIFVDDIRLYREAPDQMVVKYLAPIIEAESGIITAPFEVLSDIPGASGGQYIMVPNGGGNSSGSPAAADDGWATYNINIPADGDYVIGLRGLRQVANDGGDDSLWVRIPDAVLDHVPYQPPDWIRCGGVFPGNEQDVMVWDFVLDWFDSVLDVDPVVFTLTAGQHELHISRREDGTALDAIAIFSVE